MKTTSLMLLTAAGVSAATQLCATVGASSCTSQTVDIGTPAPAPEVAGWVKGTAIARFEKGKVYVVDFWATWCQPCIQAMPHLVELEKKYGDTAEFMSVDVWESDPKGVSGFVQKMTDKMASHVAVDSVESHAAFSSPEDAVVWANGHGKMSTSWLASAGVKQIPSTFIVDKDGVIAWIGEPSQIDEPLEKVIAGTWDRDAYKKVYAQAVLDAAALQKLNRQLDELGQKKDFDGTIKAIDGYVSGHPSTRADFLGSKYQALVRRKRFDDAKATAEYAMQVTVSDAHTPLPQMAWVTAFMTPEGSPIDIDLGMKIAVQADKMAAELRPGVKEALARFYFLRKDYAKAVEQQTKAISDSKAADKSDLQQRLDEYEKALKGG